MNCFSRRTILSLAIAGLLALPAMAQRAANPEQPKMIHLMSFQVKPDKAPDLQDLIRNRIVPAYEKNSEQLSTWRGTGLADLFRFTFVTANDKFADLDGGPNWGKAMGDGAAATTWARFRDSITSMEGSISRVRWDLSYRADSDPMTMAVIITAVAAPGANDAIEKFFKNDVVAAHKKVGSRGFVVHQNVFGGNGDRQYTVVVPIENYAELDKGSAMVRALGQEGWKKLGAQIAPLFASIEFHVARRVANLSTKTD